MSELEDLYQEVILDHSKSPRNFRALKEATHKAEGYNPLCGDRLTLYLKVGGGKILDVGFEGQGCAISKASASMMTASIKGKIQSEVQELFENFHRMLTGNPSGYDRQKLGKLTVLSGVQRFPVRVKCATLVWHTLRAAIEQSQQVVSTE